MIDGQCEECGLYPSQTCSRQNCYRLQPKLKATDIRIKLVECVPGRAKLSISIFHDRQQLTPEADYYLREGDHVEFPATVVAGKV